MQGSSSQAILVLSPKPGKEISSQAKANVLVVPYTVPKSSTIASVLGRAAQSNPWLVPREPLVATASNDLSETEVKQKEELVTGAR